MPQPPARILFVDHTALLSGGEIALLNLVSALDRARFCPVVLLGEHGPLEAELLKAGIETHVVPLAAAVAGVRKDAIGVGILTRARSMVLAARYVGTLARFIRRHRIDLVHTNSLKADVLGGLAAKLARRPLIWHVHDRIADDYLPAVVARTFRWASRVIPDFIITNSRATLATLGRHSESKTAVVYPGLKLSHPVASGDSDATHSDQDRSASGRPVIGLLGRISSWKGQHIFIRAAADVVKVFPDARFRIIGKTMFGEEAYEQEIRRLVDELQLAQHVEFSGFRSDVAAALSELSLLVHASTSGEPFGQVIVEGMAAGLPVVATRGGGVPEIVVDGETGLLVPMDDAQALGQAILQILADPARGHARGQAGRRRVQALFTIERSARIVESIYDRLLTRSR